METTPTNQVTTSSTVPQPYQSDSIYASQYGYASKTKIVPKFWKEKYEKEADRFWNKFYGNNKANFFKDRHYLTREFPELDPSNTNQKPTDEIEAESIDWKTKVLEVGCGVGNTIFPLLEDNPNVFVYGVDFSSNAINLVKSHANFSDKKCCAFVCDVTKEDFPQEIKEQSIDFAFLVFVLSAISLEKMSIVLQKIFKVLKPGGRIFVRDYALGDMAQVRFETYDPNRGANKLSENFYVRGDGTLAYYFSEDVLKGLLSDAGFVEHQTTLIKKVVENRKEGKVMDRIWIQCKFIKPT